MLTISKKYVMLEIESTGYVSYTKDLTATDLQGAMKEAESSSKFNLTRLELWQDDVRLAINHRGRWIELDLGFIDRLLLEYDIC